MPTYAVAMTLPPPMPTVSLRIVSTGIMTSAAMRRGTTSFLMGSTPSVLSASICSVTRIDPICAAIPDPDAPGDEDGGEHGTELADHRCGDEPADVHGRAELRHLHGRLECEHHAGEEAGEQNDAERLDADRVHLLNDVTAVERPGEDEPYRLGGEPKIFLDRQHPHLGAFVDACEKACQSQPARGWSRYRGG